MKVQVLGPGCPKCASLLKNTRTALAELELDADLEKVESFQEMMRAGVMSTPALVVDGVVRSTGRALSVAEVKAILS